LFHLEAVNRLFFCPAKLSVTDTAEGYSAPLTFYSRLTDKSHFLQKKEALTYRNYRLPGFIFLFSQIRAGRKHSLMVTIALTDPEMDYKNGIQ